MTERALPVTILEPAGIDPELLDHSLSLRFDLGQFDPRITFTRNSSATYFGSDGLLKTASANEPRIDYDPATGECKGFLVEASQTNLLTYSEQFDNATWNKPFNTVTLTNEILSPVGAANAYKIVRTSTSDTLALRKTGLSLPAGTTYSASIYIYVPEQSGVTSWSMTNDYMDIESISTPTYTVFNKWVRVSTSSTLGAERKSVDFNVRVNGIQLPPVGFVFYTWGAQLEAGTFPTSYIKTEATTATRAADSAVMTGANFSSWYRQDEGVFLTKYASNAPDSRPLVVARGVDATNRIQVTSTQATVLVGGAIQSALGTANNPGSAVRADAYKSNDFATLISQNGVSSPIQLDAFGSVPIVSYLTIGHFDFGGATRHCGYIAEISYYPKRLTNAKLQALTQ